MLGGCHNHKHRAFLCQRCHVHHGSCQHLAVLFACVGFSFSLHLLAGWQVMALQREFQIKFLSPGALFVKYNFNDDLAMVCCI